MQRARWLWSVGFASMLLATLACARPLPLVMDPPLDAEMAAADALLAHGDYPQALNAYLSQAARGDNVVRGAVLNRVGEIYAHGLGVRRDDGAAMDYFQKAAVLNNVYAMAHLGQAYFLGNGTLVDQDKGYLWAERAAQAGVPLALNQVGWQNLFGVGIPKDTAVARNAYLMSARAGDATGQLQTGWMYTHIAPIDYRQAMVWYRKAAAQGDALAMGNIGYLYEHGLGVPQDDAQAVQWYRPAARADNARAQFHLGKLLYQGRGVAQADAVAGERLIKRAAAQGDEEAQAWRAQPQIGSVRVLDYVQGKLSPTVRVLLLILALLLASVVYRTVRGKPLWPRKPRGALFFERMASGGSNSSVLSRLARAHGYLSVSVTWDGIRVEPMFPFNLMFVPECGDLEHFVPKRDVQKLKIKRARRGNKVVLIFRDGAQEERTLELRLRQPEQFALAVREAWRVERIEPMQGPRGAVA
ncbi:tetratricopeptide repeat protein [Amantichitinum ursilacus]|uniref:Beta-lactamase HcpA n=1 Tax=Amantichitinum ursilacus TaxID=857265 RepID=A0A0N0XIP8_9NEIS|nr:tetratricopeptide repeat protein [Amantichitinum ursilacus]KPC50283.1 Beta-lactamase HcpA precursor [Amantichitinum ursilacus]